MTPLRIPCLAALLLLASVGAAHAHTPTVTVHGMGDSCFNIGFRGITRMVGEATGGYASCIPMGDTWLADTDRGFLYSMTKSVDAFAKRVRADPKLANGFNVVGFSQGNSIIRGYIHKYNNPPVRTFLSVHGTLMGVAGFPHCGATPSGKRARGGEVSTVISPLCRMVDRFLGGLAYTELSQDTLLQAGYYRDPTRLNATGYRAYSELAQWNGEGEAAESTMDGYKARFLAVDKYVMIKATGDSMVYPAESEWWGEIDPHNLDAALPMRHTQAYLTDAFGLQTADKMGKLVFNSTDGDHLQFSNAELNWWVQNYFTQ